MNALPPRPGSGLPPPPPPQACPEPAPLVKKTLAVYEEFKTVEEDEYSRRVLYGRMNLWSAQEN